MPYASYKTVINAPYERLAHLLIDKIERPKKYVAGVLYSEILERGKDFVIRQMYAPKPVPMTIKEKIYQKDIAGGRNFIYEHMNNADYSGTFENRLTQVPGRADQVEVEYIMDWKPHPGKPDKLTEQASGMVERAVKHLKGLAEREVKLPELPRRFFAAIDALSADEFPELLAKDCKFRIGNMPEINGLEAILKVNSEVMKQFEGMHHDFESVTTEDNRTCVESWVEYRLVNKSTYLLPFMTLFEHKDNKITGIKIFGDMSPLKHGWE
jgi:SnoaL-like domain